MKRTRLVGADQSDRPRKRSRGSALAEFAPALFILIIGVTIPLLDLGFVPIRVGLAYAVLTDVVRNIALSNKATDAYAKVKPESWWSTTLAKCGVKVRNPELFINVIGPNNERQRVTSASVGSIPANLLPDPIKGTGIYRLELVVDMDISPLLVMGGKGIPGLTSPVSMTMRTEAAWENLGRDPETKEYYINE
jgi:hypothetical protein